MLISGSGGEPRGARVRVQAHCAAVPGGSGMRRCAVATLALLLSGCSSLPSSMNPVSWWHDLQGGKIAEERPPPPGADQPYPNLASVPPKPEQPDRAALANIAKALIADRTNAQHVAAAAPLPDPSSPNASPGLFGRGTVTPPPPPPPPGTQTASATMPAAQAPPAPAAPPPAAPAPAKAPVAAVQSTPLEAPPPTAQTATNPAAPVSATPAAAPLAPPGSTAQPPAVAAASPPPLPAAPPPPPNLPGVSQSPVAAPAPPPSPTAVAAATSAAPPPSSPASSVSVTFVNGSAELPAAGADTLKALAAKRGAGLIAVTGYGDAASNDPDAQLAALALGLSRAQAMAAALKSAGVPASAVQIDASAIGRGGTARLVQ